LAKFQREREREREPKPTKENKIPRVCDRNEKNYFKR
jgi:hypothetical protein